jgi:PAS domain S-box-containing protein
MQRDFFQPLVENALDVITVLSGDGIIRYESASIERMLGYKPGELIGKSFFDFIHPDDVPNVISTLNDGLQIPGCIASLEFRFQHKDSSWRNLETIGKNLLDNPSVEGIVLSFRDITARVQAEKELQQNFEKLRGTLEGTIATLAAITENRDPYTMGHQQRVTRLACAIAEEMGLPAQQIEGIRVAGTIHDIGKIGVLGQLHLSGQDFEQVVQRPSSFQTFGFDATLGCLLLFQQVQSDASHNGEVLCSISFSYSTVIFSESDI